MSAAATVSTTPRFRGRTIHYRPGDLLLAQYRRRGPVLSLGVGNTRYVYLLGPEANQFVFSHSELFRWHEAFAGLIPVDGPTSLIVSDGEDHRRRRRLVQPALHRNKVNGYLGLMADCADTAIDALRPGRTVDAYQLFRAAIRRSTIRSLFGEELAADADTIGQELQPVLDVVDQSPQRTALQRRWNTPRWRRAMCARELVDQRLYAEIRRVRQGERRDGDHVLATLVHGRDEDDDGLTDAEVRDQAVTLIAAGYETTSAAMSWALYALLTTPGVWDTARREVDAVLGGRRPSAEDLQRLPYLHGVVQETLRLYPPAVVTARAVVEDFTFDGKRVPSGSLVMPSAYVTHRLPEVWTDPLEFRPQRFTPGSPDYRKPSPHEFLPFSAGPHRCIGSTMATTELAVMLTRLLARTTLHLPDQRIRPTNFAAMRPRNGLLVEVGSVDR